MPSADRHRSARPSRASSPLPIAVALCLLAGCALDAQSPTRAAGLVATHAIGHALGFGHPADPAAPGVNHISGTQSAADPNLPSYPSMMWGGTRGCFTGSGNVTLGLSNDDVASANVKYP